MRTIATIIVVIAGCFIMIPHVRGQVKAVPANSNCYDAINSMRYKSAIECLTSQLQNDDQQYRQQVLLAIGEIYLELLQPYEAIKYFEKVSDEPRNLYMGYAYYLMEDWGKSESVLKRHIGSSSADIKGKAIASLMVANIYHKRVVSLYDQLSIWSIKEPEGAPELKNKAWTNFSQFLDYWDVIIKDQDDPKLNIPTIIRMDFNYLPDDQLSETEERLRDLSEATDDAITKAEINLYMAEVSGKKYIDSIQESDEFFSPTSYLYWSDTEDLTTKLTSRFGNSNYKRRTEKRFEQAFELLESAGADSLTFSRAHLRYGSYQMRITEEFEEIIEGISLRQLPHLVEYKDKASGELQAFFLKALDSYHESIKLSVVGFENPDLGTNPDFSLMGPDFLEDQIRSVPVLAEALRGKASVLTRARGFKTPNPEDFVKFHLLAFKVTFETIMVMDFFIDVVLQSLSNDNDKFFYASRIKDDRLFAIDYCMTRFGSQPSDKFLNSGLMKLMVNEDFTDPMVLDALERERTDAFKKSKDHVSFITNGYSVDMNKDSTYLHLAYYFIEKTKAYSLLTAMSQSRTGNAYDPGEIKIGGLTKIQESLDDKTAVVEFIFTRNFLYRFTITNKNFTVVRLRRKGEDDVAKEVKAIRNGIMFYLDDVYAENAFSLNKKLFPKFDENIQNLVIIPDGLMYMIPFEVLLTKKVPKKKRDRYGEFPYLMNAYNISYALSGALYYINNQEPATEDRATSFIGFAPVFSDEVVSENITVRQFDSLNEDSQRAILLDGTYVSPLPGTESELSVIGDLFKAANRDIKLYVNTEASEESIKSLDLTSSQFVHIATHGFVNTDDPERSGIMFYPKEESEEDGILYGKEIYELTIDTDLVVLSACETGLGKVVSGEGLIGLTRALQYAGARNQIVSMWKVSDASTSQLMKAFYSFILNNNNTTYSQALTQVKRDMLSSSSYAHPYFWSPFVLLGH